MSIPSTKAIAIETRRRRPEPASTNRIDNWSGYRPFVVKQRVRESETISSFYLARDDGQPLPSFKPGQHVTFRLELPGRAEPLLRSYTLSDKPDPLHYRVTVKREPGTNRTPPGLGSNYFHAQVGAGTRLWMSAPSGGFHLDPEELSPVALISAGVGVTPMISMLDAIAVGGTRRPVWFIHGARNGREHAMGALVRRLVREHDNVHAHICYSRPTDSDRRGRHYDTVGHVDGALLQRLLPHARFDFYLCGPGRFIEGLRDALLDWGVDAQRIRSEHFGAASAPDDIPTPDASVTESVGKRPVQVHFKRSGVVVRWEPGTASLLDLAEKRGLVPDSACRVGICQICTRRLVQGEVAYAPTPASMPEPGFILPCCTRPISDVVVDL
ncbi:MAG: 2Fe-2S iron-sulfur cluster binding domain-containing protein [Chromatiaceae bacterium]|nr:2Fe-2S iron-sulfur cluster binding domain-containing protein [Chromatiaceae bacterium]